MTLRERLHNVKMRAIQAEADRVICALEEQQPIPRSDAPPLEEFQRILTELQENRTPHRRHFLRGAQ